MKRLIHTKNVVEKKREINENQDEVISRDVIDIIPGQIPLYLAIKQKDIDSFYCLCRCMIENKINIKMYLSEREYVAQMIEFGFELLKNESSGIVNIQLLLSTFNYPEIFRFCSNITGFDATIESNDISLIKFVSISNDKNLDQMTNILFEKCGLTDYENERCELQETKDTQVSETKTSEEKDIMLNADDNIVKDEAEDEDEEKEKHEAITQDNMIDEQDKITEIDVEEVIKENKPLDWIEIMYSTIVEIFSALDLYTDIIILFQLYKSNNQWWTIWMTCLCISPYLVSHGSLVETIKKKINFVDQEQSCCSGFVSFTESLLMTPVSIFYLLMIDVIFMLFSLISTAWFFVVLLFFGICKCNLENASRYDIRGWIDDKIF
eukprot:277709_1